MLFPDFNNNIVSLSNSLLKHYGIKPFHPTLGVLDEVLAQGKKNIIFMILDGLGENILKKHLKEQSFLRRHCVGTISSVFPPTTAAATTSFHSGLYPIEHGWLGWMPYFKDINRVVEIFLNRDYYSGEKLGQPKLADLLPYKTIYKRITEHNPAVKYHQVFPDFVPNGAKSFAEMCVKISDIVAKDNSPKLISSYWINPDSTTHDYGVSSPEVRDVLSDIDNHLQKLSQNLTDTLLIISADHSQIDVEYISLNGYPELDDCLRLPLSLEGRCASLYIRDDKREFFSQRFQELFGEYFILLSKQDFLQSGLLGKGIKHPMVDDFIGDFVAIGIKNKCISYQEPGGIKHTPLLGNHAGLTAEEMNVPLILFEAD